MSDLVQTAWAWLLTGAWLAAAGRLLVAVAIVAAAFVAARGLGVALRRLRGRARAGAPLIYIIERLAGYAVVLAGFLVGLSTLGINLTSLTVFAGAVGVGVGLGLQGVVREFVSGLVMIFDPLLRVGDFVELDNGVRGEIVEVGPRATRLRTNDGPHIIIPNSKLIESQVLNWTFRSGTGRIRVPFSVAYGVDKGRVRDVVLAAARSLPFTREDGEDHRTQVWLTGFGESALNFELVVWPSVEAVRRPAAMRAAYTWAIDDALRAAGIEIPFPQVDLRVRSLFGREGDPALDALGLAPKAAQPCIDGREEAAQGPVRNDAAQAVLDDARREAREREVEAKPDPA